MSNYETKTVWITRYALSYGIIGPVDLECNEKYAMWRTPDGYAVPQTLGKDAHFSEADAIDRAKKMASNKIASLKKQLSKLEELERELIK